jgi:hypothetical protein
MRTARNLSAVAAIAGTLIKTSVLAQVAVPCTPGAAPQWSSGWCDFASPTKFAKGERLRLAVGGSATKIIVRLLPLSGKGREDTSMGAIPTPMSVPPSRFIELTVPYDATDITQISVHGGAKPWNLYDLGAGNGPATITGVERMPSTPRGK